MKNLPLFLLIANLLIIRISSSYVYELIFSNDFESELGWKNYKVPCENDIILFEKNKTNIISINQHFKASSIVLPDNGVLYIGDNVKIGKKGRWQCQKNDIPQQRNFNISSRDRPNFYDPIHWKIKEREYHKDYLNRESLLHFQRVPDSRSTVVIPYGVAAQIQSKRTIKFQSLINRYQVSL
uniref:Protein amnionless n=1 Tax=Strongyloides papillosus TaxID=174720 RepID=A0A0N5BS93_STREA